MRRSRIPAGGERELAEHLERDMPKHQQKELSP